MSALIPFAFDGEPVRAVVVDGEPHLVASDVAARLGYVDTARAIRQHAKGRAKRLPLWTAGGTQEVRVLAEPDVLRLIIASKLPAAERFERWVFEEVLPSIRRTGTYAAKRDPVDVLGDPRALRCLLLGYTERLAASEERVAALEPKAAAMERLEAADGSMSLTLAAKALGLARDALIKRLSELHWIYKPPGGRWTAYQTALSTGRMEHRAATFMTRNGHERVSSQAVITAKGLAKLAELLAEPAGDVESRKAA